MAKKYMNLGKVVYQTTWESASQYWAQFRDATTGLGADFASMVLTTDASGNGTFTPISDFSGAGNVVGPATATDNAVVRFDGTTGELIQNSVVLIGDTGIVTGVLDLTLTGTLSGAVGTFSSTLGVTGVLTASNAANVIRIGTSCDMTTPPAIGAVTPNTGKFTTLNATGAVDLDTTLNVDGAADLNSTLNVDGNVTLQGDVQQTNDAPGACAYVMTSYGTTNATVSQIFQQRARGTLASPAIVQDHDFLSNYRSDAWDGAKFVRTLNVRVRVAEGSAPALDDVRGTMYWYHGRKATASPGYPGDGDTPNADPEDVLMKLVPSDAYPRLGNLEVTGSITVAGVLVASGGVSASGLSSTTSVIANIDTDANSTSEVFAVRSNGDSTNQFSVSEAGNLIGLGTLTMGSGTTVITDAAGKVLAAALNTVGVPQGGSGATTLTGLLQGNGASAFTAITDSVTGGEVLRVIGVNTYAWGALDLASANAVTGTLPVGKGGSGAATLTGLLQGNGTSAFTVITDSSTVGQVLRVTGSNAYGWGALNLSDTDAVTGTLPDANVVDALTISGGTINNSIIGGSTPAAGSFTTLSASSTLAVTGTATFGGNAVSGPTVNVNGAGSTFRQVLYQTAGVVRWATFATNTAESGANAGSNWALRSFTDAGAVIDDPITVARVAAGAIVIGGSTARPVTLTGALNLNGSAALGDASTDTITCAGRFIPRTASSGNSNAGEIAYSTANWYGSTADTVWKRFLTNSDVYTKDIFIPTPTSSDDIPLFRVDVGVTVTKIVYSIGGTTNWVGRVQKANDAQGTSQADLQAADSTVTGTTTVTSFSSATLTAGQYFRLLSTSISGTPDWLHISIVYTVT